MSLNKLIRQIENRKEIQEAPPVLLDIGASNDLNPLWSKIAHFSIGIAFDADDRDFNYIERKDSKFKKLYVFNKLVVDKSSENREDFYLTQSPYCSSLLKPNHSSLKYYEYSDYFHVKEVSKMDSIALDTVLKELNINQIDWFKSDSQGIDLRLFKSVEEPIKEKVILAIFEPGFIDAYENEDKISHLLSYMDHTPFFLVDFYVKGPIRMPKDSFNSLFRGKYAKKMAKHMIDHVPGWAEIIYMNKMESPDFTIREFLLGWLFSTILERHELAFMVAQNGYEKFQDDLLLSLQEYSRKELLKNIYSFNSFVKVAGMALKKYLR